MTKNHKLILILGFVTIISSWLFYCPKVFAADDQITMYQSIFAPVADKNNKRYIAIRFYYAKGDYHFIVVDPDTLKTYKKDAADLSFRWRATAGQDNGYFLMKQLDNTRYFKLLKQYSSPHYPPTAGYGLKHIKNDHGVFLTIDMCPSSRPFEKEFFQNLVAISEKNNQPIPIAIAISGMWMLDHSEEFTWLTQQKGKLDITWINHSFAHLYYSDLPEDHNFLLLPNTDMKNEILLTEQLLIAKGETPSVFFRFPGLISDGNLVHNLNQFGLIPISTDAWLAKGEQAKTGSIILIHGNSNEHPGVVLMTKILEDGKLKLLPLNE